jgi:hypothetical protein
VRACRLSIELCVTIDRGTINELWSDMLWCRNTEMSLCEDERLLNITDNRSDGLPIDLHDVLRPLMAEVVESCWEIDAPDCSGEAAEEFDAIAAQKSRISGQSLLDLVGRVHQVIDGDFTAYRSYEDVRPWFVVRAVDSTSYDVETDDEAILTRYGRVSNV